MVKWTPEKFTTKDRMKAANEILKELKDKYKESLIAVAIEGSTAKGLDAPESDLELRVLLDKDYNYHRWYAFFYEKMFVGISYNSVSKALEASKGIDYEWSISGDNLETAEVIFDSRNVYGELKANNKAAEQNADFEELFLEATTDMYERVYKVYTLSRMNYIGMTREVANIAYWAALAVGLANRVKYRSNKTMVEDSFALENTPENYEQHVRSLFLNTDIDDIQNAVSDLWMTFDNWIQQEVGMNLNDDHLRYI
ncbi:kanamycin nucleotidyltransferase C-terminal domain-containing protein [Salimicrobium halophilum]|uniref:Kanamycin nucleotidyltransferase n=1 Tax=Salimicrobium halophilum TaxID=86666 RepID=A0A1G8RCZ0_9BACI|nr:kanamycin nucleotidyltransferase C-terminal domain-containing protein [Salimicrobium halophilum]SDJ14779.1 kanamycin nucleotidyltransferase [Salimicrobium halophilum]